MSTYSYPLATSLIRNSFFEKDCRFATRFCVICYGHFVFFGSTIEAWDEWHYTIYISQPHIKENIGYQGCPKCYATSILPKTGFLFLQQDAGSYSDYLLRVNTAALYIWQISNFALVHRMYVMYIVKCPAKAWPIIHYLFDFYQCTYCHSL